MNRLTNIRKKQNKKGFVLPIVIVFMLVGSVLLATAFHMVTTNTKIAYKQFQYMKAHYLAVSGVEMAYGALFVDGEDIFNQYKLEAQNCISTDSNPTSADLLDTITIDGENINLKMHLLRKGSEQTLDNYYIHIESVSKTDDGEEYTIVSDVSVFNPALIWTKQD